MFRRVFLGSKRVYCRITANNAYSWRSGNRSCACLGGGESQNKLSSVKRVNTLSIYRLYSQGLLDGDYQLSSLNDELKLIKNKFPSPRETLNNYATKTPDKVFDVHYKQSATTAKGGKKVPLNNEWTCTYVFVWPEKMKFNCTGKSKKLAAESAAIQALQWLWENKRINKKGEPIYDKQVLSETYSKLNEPLTACLSEASVARIEKAWQDYENGIRDEYERVHQVAMSELPVTASKINKDSTLDDEEDLRMTRDEPDTENNQINSVVKTGIHPVYCRPVHSLPKQDVDRRNKQMKETFDIYEKNLTPLPIDKYMQQITSTISENRVTVIVGAAGCGKSTRVPAAILKDGLADVTALVGEPRRVAAMGLAKRVADEMGEDVGESIGYQVRLRGRPPRGSGGAVLYCTSGVLLRRLQDNPGLKGCSHVILDEAHERDVNTDLALCLLKRALTLNDTLKLVIMSATLDVNVFTRYFDACPVIEVPGTTYPVEVLHLDTIRDKFFLKLHNTVESCRSDDQRVSIDCKELVQVIKAIDKAESDGAILVFLPGWAEISHCQSLLDQAFGQNTHLILPVHSKLSIEEQSKIFSTPPPGIRKIVLCTNIAETSLTVPDVTVVIDSGARRENNTTAVTGVATLGTVWVTKANAKQRAGRAGRVQPGTCYRLYTKEKEAEFLEHTLPEILRVPLEQVVLDSKSYAPHDKAQSFLSQLPEPPSANAIQHAVHDLIDLGALTPQEKLTPLGSKLCTLTMQPRLAASLVHSHALCTVTAVANIVTMLAGNVHLHGSLSREEIRTIKKEYNSTSDHVSLHNILEEFELLLNDNTSKRREHIDDFIQKRGLRKDSLYNVRALSNIHLEQLLTCMPEQDRERNEQLNKYADINSLVIATLLAGCNRLLYTKKVLKSKGKIGVTNKVFTSTGEKAHISSESVNFTLNKDRSKGPQLLAYFSGLLSTERRALIVDKTSLIVAPMALLFCKGDLRVIEMDDNEFNILSLPSHRLEVFVPKSQSALIVKLKEMLWNTLQYNYEVTPNSVDSNMDMSLYRFKNRLIKTVGRILVESQTSENCAIESVDN